MLCTAALLIEYVNTLDNGVMADMEPTAILEDEEFTRKPYSYGPFKIAEWESGAKIVLEKNENYWRADEGLPFLDSVIHQFIPDTNAILAAMTSGEIDVGTQGGLGLGVELLLEVLLQKTPHLDDGDAEGIALLFLHPVQLPLDQHDGLAIREGFLDLLANRGKRGVEFSLV